MNRISLSFNPLIVFISSSWKDNYIKDEIEQAKKFISSLYLKPYLGDAGSPNTSKTHSVQRVRESNILILILGEKYSETVKQEYIEAKENDLPILVFIKGCPDMDKKLKGFFEYLKGEHTYSRFNDNEEFKTKLSEDIMRLISDKFRYYQIVHKSIISLLEDYVIKIPKNLLEKLKKIT